MKCHRKPLLAITLLTMALMGCAQEDPRNLISPKTAADVRPAATAAATNGTTLEGPGLTLTASRSVDNCGVDATGLQPADYSRTYRCGLGRVALYSVAGATAADAAARVDSAMTARGCTSEAPLSSDADAVSAVESVERGTHVINTFYLCGEDGAKAMFGLATDVGVATNLPSLPPSPFGTPVVEEPPIEAMALESATSNGDRFVLVLYASIEYFKTSVCDGLRRC